MNSFMFTVPDDSFQVVGIHKGDTLIFEDIKPTEGNFTLLQYKGQCQLVQVIGKDYLKHPILCSHYTTYPHAFALSVTVELKGRMVEVIRSGI